jgi:hypothetical protein
MIAACELMAVVKEHFKLGSKIWYSQHSNAFVLHETKYYVLINN